MTKLAVTKLLDAMTPIREIGLDAATFRLLRDRGIITVGDLSKWSYGALLGIHGFSLNNYDNLIKSLKLTFAKPGESFLKPEPPSYKNAPHCKLLHYLYADTQTKSYILQYQDDNHRLHDDISIDEAGFTGRITNSLHRAGIHTLSELVVADVNKIKLLPRFGKESFANLVMRLSELCVIKYF